MSIHCLYKFQQKKINESSVKQSNYNNQIFTFISVQKDIQQLMPHRRKIFKNAIAAQISSQSSNSRIGFKNVQSQPPLFANVQIVNSDIKYPQKISLLRNTLSQKFIEKAEQGEIDFQNKDHYEGSLQNNKMHGNGAYYFYSKKLKYIGQFLENHFHGWGTILKNHDDDQSVIYQGSFQYGKKHGEGKYQYSPGHYYKGSWVQDKKQGQGTYHYSEGFYDGQWHQNKKHGQGTLKLNNGTEFKGTFAEDLFVKGLIKYPNGDEYIGQFINNSREGQGSYFSAKTRERYKGQWQKNKKHGEGAIILENGDEIQCNFINGKIDETQSCTYKWNSSDDGSIFNGWLKNGRPEKGYITRKNGSKQEIF